MSTTPPLAGAVAALSDAALLEQVAAVEELGRLVDARRVQLAAEVAERSRFELGAEGLARRMGHARPGHLLERLTRTSAHDIGARLALGRLVRERTSLDGSLLPPLYPQVADSLASGGLGVESARVITRALEQAARSCAPDELTRAEDFLVSSAREFSSDLVFVQARVWRDTLDPDGIEPREEALRALRSFRFGREVDGMARLTIDASGTDLAELRATFGAYASPRIAPRFLGLDDLDPADPFIETRTSQQRDFDVFMGLIRAGARSDATRPGSRAVVTIVSTGSRANWLDGVDEPVGASTLAELACSGESRQATVDSAGALLSLGFGRRMFSEAQHAALAIRDGGCIWPHCTAPPSWCDAHHVLPWSHDGPTDIDNGALLCPAHHRLLHASDFELRMKFGVPELRAPARLDPTSTWRRVGGHRALAVVRE